jgi:hypothetical protein
MTTDLRKLATPIPARYIGQNDKGMPAADHTVITQLLHLYVPGWSFEVVEVLRTDVPEKQGKSKSWPGGHYVTGVVGRLSATVDGHRQVIEEAGGVENVQMHDGDGERLKHATSDALKRCAMRLGLGLHIWAQGNYFLDRAIDKHADDDSSDGGGEGPATGHEPPSEAQQPAPVAPAVEPARSGEAASPRTGAPPPVAASPDPSPSDRWDGDVPEVEAPFDWRAVAMDAGVTPTAVLATIVQAWPQNDQAARPNRLRDVDELVAAGVAHDLIRDAIDRTAGGEAA